MSIPLSVLPSKRRVHRKRRTQSAAPTVVGPILVDADFDSDDLKLELDFDRAVSVAAFVPSSIVVNDPASGMMYHATNAQVFGGQLVIVAMVAGGASSGTQTILNASATSGIVAVDGGDAWAGVTDLGLPFP